MKTNMNKLFASLLVAALVLTMLPTMAFATAAPVKKADSGLSSLSMSGVRLEPSFSKSTTSYNAFVPNGTKTTTVRPTAADKAAAVTVNGTAVASGQSTPVELSEGSNSVAITVTNGTGDTASTTTYTVNIERLESGQSPVRITTDSIPDAVVGRGYSARISATGSGTKSWWMSEDELPDGLKFNGSSGMITGTPKAGSEGSYTITVSVDSSSNGTTDTEDFNLTVYERGTNLNDSEEEEPASSSRPAPARPAAPAKPAAQTGTGSISQSGLLNSVQGRIDAAAAGAAVNVRYKNLGTVELKTLQAIAKAAGSHAVSLGSERQDGNGNVESRVTVDPKKSTKDISLLSSTTISSENCKNVTALMNRFYSNQVSVIRLDQKGAYGQTVTVYAKLDNPRLNTGKLQFYSYDSAANKLDALTTGYGVNEAGYVTFNTTVGNYVIVTDSAMRQK
jgi:hypothetical protein